MAKRRLARPPSSREKRKAKSHWITWAIAGGSLVVIGLMIALIVMEDADKAPRGKSHVGEPVPDFTLRLVSGGSVSFSSLKGKPVLINFWAST
jgi:cytochrome oxidase Cu insertion factor (SCO1/SenC/PrrC family)